MLLAGFFAKSSSASCFELTATKTDAPEPLIRALPNCDNQFNVDATSENSLQTIASRSFLNSVKLSSLEKSAIFNGFASLVNAELAKTCAVDTCICGVSTT